jgi:hypothetical protein
VHVCNLQVRHLQVGCLYMPGTATGCSITLYSRLAGLLQAQPVAML